MEKEMTIDKWIKERRSTFLNGLKEGGRIDDSIIEALLENATWAPSHGLVQPWHFKIFTDRGLERFYLRQQEIYKNTTPKEKFNELKYSKFPEKAKKVSHVIAILVKRDPRRRFPKQEDLVAAACATQNMYLSLKAYDVAGYLSTGDVCYQQAMRDFLGLEEEDECIGFLTLGIADESAKPRSSKRIPASEKTEWIRE
jgi:nitroreductase